MPPNGIPKDLAIFRLEQAKECLQHVIHCPASPPIGGGGSVGVVRLLESMGLKPMDARHLAAAEAAGADFLLTTDEKFIKRCAKNNLTAVKVIDPLDF
jgi:predicted nucleic acid-binding protein